MLPTKITAPHSMSRMDTLRGLWNCSSPASFFKTIPNGDELRQKQEASAWQDRDAIEQAMRKRPYIDYFGGRCIKTDMSKFPELDLASYQQQCGIEMTSKEIIEQCLNRP